MMPSYKINNSYTVYVNYHYINACTKASKNKRKQAYTQNSGGFIVASAARKNAEAVKTLPVGALLQHKKYGVGTVVSVGNDGIIRVAFADREARFVYADAVKNGFLTVIGH